MIFFKRAKIMIIDIGYEVKNLKTLLITIQGIICHRTIKPCYFKAYYKTLSIPPK